MRKFRVLFVMFGVVFGFVYLIVMLVWGVGWSGGLFSLKVHRVGILIRGSLWVLVGSLT